MSFIFSAMACSLSLFEKLAIEWDEKHAYYNLNHQ